MRKDRNKIPDQEIENAHPTVRQTILAALTERTSPAPKYSATRKNTSQKGGEREILRESLATLLKIPSSAVADAKLDESIRLIRIEAEENATRMGAYFDTLEAHFTAIGCLTKQDMSDYFDSEEQVLLELYAEASRAQPSPTRLLQLSVQCALDARHRIDKPIRQFDIRRRFRGYEIAIYPQGLVKLSSVPYPARIVQSPFVIQLLDLVRQATPPQSNILRLLELWLNRVPATPRSSQTQASMAPQTDIKVILKSDESYIVLFETHYAVSMDAARFINALIVAPNTWVSTADLMYDELLKDTRIDRLVKKLPKPILAVIESRPGAGYRLRRERLAELCQNPSIATPVAIAEDGKQV